MFKPISRRTALRGAGAALTLPFLDCMVGSVSAGEKLTKPPVRAAFMFKPNGVYPKSWIPKRGEGDELDMSPAYLKPMSKHKDDIVFLENLWNRKSVGRNGHWPKVPAWLSGGFVERTTGRDMDIGGRTVDQLLAAEIGHETPLPSIELGVDSPRTGVDNVGGGFTRIYGNHIAWRDSHTPVPNEITPRHAFDRLFRSGPGPVLDGLNPNHPKVKKSMIHDRRSILDLTRESATALNRKYSKRDREKVDEYFESVRSIEKRIEASMRPQKRWVNKGKFEIPRPESRVPRDHETHLRLMLDIMVLAFWTDTTRVATFMFGNAQSGRNFSFLDGVKGSYHGLSHHRNEDSTRKQYEKIGIWHSHQMAYLLDRMKSLDEGDGTLLDNSMIMYGSSISDGNSHNEHNLPLILIGKGGGTIRTGRRLAAKRDTPLCNLYLSMMDRMGVQRKTFGDSNGKVNLS